MIKTKKLYDCTQSAETKASSVEVMLNVMRIAGYMGGVWEMANSLYLRHDPEYIKPLGNVLGDLGEEFACLQFGEHRVALQDRDTNKREVKVASLSWNPRDRGYQAMIGNTKNKHDTTVYVVDAIDHCVYELFYKRKELAKWSNGFTLRISKNNDFGVHMDHFVGTHPGIKPVEMSADEFSPL